MKRLLVLTVLVLSFLAAAGLSGNLQAGAALAGGGGGGPVPGDTDGDMIPDSDEMTFGSNPSDPLSIPESPYYFGWNCFDFVDNDRDGHTDSLDVGCDTTTWDSGTGSAVSVATDYDGDGFNYDYEVRVFGSAEFDPASTPEHSTVPGSCIDGIDNDGDGLADAADTGTNPVNPPSFDSGCSPDSDSDLFGDGVETTYGSDQFNNKSTPESYDLSSVGAWWGFRYCHSGLDEDADGSTDSNDSGCHLLDSDGDGAPDTSDNCPLLWNAGQADADADGKGDACDHEGPSPNMNGLGGTDDCSDAVDNNGNGLVDAQEPACAPPDYDGDGVPDNVDNCAAYYNPGQEDSDSDGIGNPCDWDTWDDDGDGVLNGIDNCPGTPNANQVDFDGNGQGDACDPDDDNDGVPDVSDAFPLNPGESVDTDGDGTGNNADTDDDGDGQSDADETACGSDQLSAASLSPDNDGDGSPDCVDPDDDNDGAPDGSDAFPLDPGESVDTDGDGTGDNADADDDGDGQSDADEAACGSDALSAASLSPDNDGDGSPDCVDADDDNDGVPDGSDGFPLDPGESVDTDGDGTGDSADTDDDADGQSDADESSCGSDPLQAASLSPDNDGDGSPDCVDPDDDNDGVPDVSDAFPLDPGESVDTDGDGTGNNADTDDDGDGQSDADEAACGSDPLDAASVCVAGEAPCDGADNDGDGLIDEDNWVIQRFEQPINDPLGTMSVFKKGSTVPVKVRLYVDCGALVPVSDAQAQALASGGFVELFIQQGECPKESAVNEAVSTTQSDAGNNFHYDSASDLFIYNWGTKSTLYPSGYTYTLVARILDQDGHAITPNVEHGVFVALNK